jgi:hypothetical protein
MFALLTMSQVVQTSSVTSQICSTTASEESESINDIKVNETKYMFYIHRDMIAVYQTTAINSP